MSRTLPARFLVLSCLFAALGLPARADAPASERKDADGDPLPAGAFARLGSKRYRLPAYLGSARLSPDGKLVAIGGGGPEIILLDVETGKEARRLRTTAGANFLLYGPKGKTIASTWYDGFIRFWDTTTGAQVHQVSTGPVRANTFTLSADGKVLALAPPFFGKKGTAHVYEADTGKERCRVEVQQMTNVQTGLSGDGKLLATWGCMWFGGAADREKQERIARTVQL